MAVKKKVKPKVKPKPKPKVKKKKAAPPIVVFDQVRDVVKKARPFQIVKGQTYLYFCITPSQEAIVFQHILSKPPLSVTAVYNYKDNIIGYLVEFKKKPHLDISKTAEGAAIFFSDKTEHKKPTLLFSDQKLRVLSFQNQDFYVSVKWKSNISYEE